MDDKSKFSTGLLFAIPVALTLWVCAYVLWRAAFMWLGGVR